MPPIYKSAPMVAIVDGIFIVPFKIKSLPMVRLLFSVESPIVSAAPDWIVRDPAKALLAVPLPLLFTGILSSFTLRLVLF